MRPMAPWKRLAFVVVTLLLFSTLLELVARTAYYQVYKNPEQSESALLETVYAINRAYTKRYIQKEVAATKDFNEKIAGAYEALFSSSGTDLLREFQARYEKHFLSLLDDAQSVRSRLLVLYLPSTKPDSPQHISEKTCREFFRTLCKTHGVNFLDATTDLRRQDWNMVSLLPDNTHLSRYGNYLIAKSLRTYLESTEDARTDQIYSGKPSLCGGLGPNMNEIWEVMPSMVYRVITNKQGFRNKKDLDVPKTRQRVLILGDSFTFGPYLPNMHTYPALLQTLLPHLEIINAGVSGYSIVEQAYLFHNRAKHVAPDITILQVLDNDLYGMFYFKQNQFGLEPKNHQPSSKERAFLDRLIEKNR